MPSTAGIGKELERIKGLGSGTWLRVLLGESLLELERKLSFKPGATSRDGCLETENFEHGPLLPVWVAPIQLPGGSWLDPQPAHEPTEREKDSVC